MKPRTKALHDYLLKSGVLNSSEEEILRAKQQYRKEYKQRWKRGRILQKEIRVELSLRQYNEVKIRAHDFSLNPTSFLRVLLRAAIEEKAIIANRDELLELLQIISMATIAVAKNSIPHWELSEQLSKAEQLLLDYLKKGV